MTDAEILDWIEGNAVSIYLDPRKGGGVTVVQLFDEPVTAESLRDCVIKANEDK